MNNINLRDVFVQMTNRKDHPCEEYVDIRWKIVERLLEMDSKGLVTDEELKKMIIELKVFEVLSDQFESEHSGVIWE